jgi:hypothetical protein
LTLFARGVGRLALDGGVEIPDPEICGVACDSAWGDRVTLSTVDRWLQGVQVGSLGGRGRFRF